MLTDSQIKTIEDLNNIKQKSFSEIAEWCVNKLNQKRRYSIGPNRRRKSRKHYQGILEYCLTKLNPEITLFIRGSR